MGGSLVVLGSSEMRETVRITFRFDASAAYTVLLGNSFTSVLRVWCSRVLCTVLNIGW